jgi:asparagine synthase (glutamine-hydrolysing)
MCSINGFTFEDKNLISQMNEKTKHRGPDGSGFWSAEGITLGHNRLSIIDVSNASSQPMISKDGRYIITYNGELYNFKELKNELEGVRFNSSGDTEVVLESYIKWGEKCLNKFDGMFAFAIWDTHEKSLFLARDHFGIKPLYYSIHDSHLFFSSEIKGILVNEKIPRNLSIESLNHYMRLLYVPEPMTMFKDIFKLPQGGYGVFKNGILTIKRYDQANIVFNKDSHKEIVTKIHQKISSSVERQLVSDKPVGIYLSGGIDSSIILDRVSRNHKNVKTFSVGFSLGEGEQAEKYNKDIDIARETAKIYKTDHHEIFLSSQDVIDSLQDVVYYMDEPISNPTTCALFALSKETKKHVDVVLSGDGGDELFAGYERYRLSYYATLYQILPLFIRNILSKINYRFVKLGKVKWIERYAQFMFQKDSSIEFVFKNGNFMPNVTSEYIEKYMSGNNFEEVIMNADRKTWLVDFALMISDTMSMANGLEVRVPLLDREVVDYANTIPSHKKMSLFTNKKLLKQAFNMDLTS